MEPVEIENSGVGRNDIYDELDSCAHMRNHLNTFRFKTDINILLDKNHTPLEDVCLICQSLFIFLCQNNEDKNEENKDKEVEINGE